jgi:hypothetical protein
MAANLNPIFTLTPHVGAVKCTTANTSYTPTYATNTFDVYVGATNGSTIENVHVKGTVTPSVAAVVRLWIYDLTTMWLWHEIPVTVITGSNSVATFEADWQPPNTLFVLPSGWKLVATLSVDATNNNDVVVIANGGDF